MELWHAIKHRSWINETPAKSWYNFWLVSPSLESRKGPVRMWKLKAMTNLIILIHYRLNNFYPSLGLQGSSLSSVLVATLRLWQTKSWSTWDWSTTFSVSVSLIHGTIFYVRQVRILLSQHVSSPPFEYYLRLGDKTRKCRESRKKDQRIFLLLLT